MPSFLTDSMPLTPSWWDIAARIVLTVIAGGLIGLDRERGGHAAGFRTTILVALAACLAMIQANLLLSTYGKTFSYFTQMDVLRFPLGVLTGVGFLGGGAILRRGDMMTGVTTAATLWFIDGGRPLLRRRPDCHRDGGDDCRLHRPVAHEAPGCLADLRTQGNAGHQ